jgi:proteasome lid subunit RPN8/RPN11
MKFTDTTPKIQLPVWNDGNQSGRSWEPHITVAPHAYEQALAHIQGHAVERGGLLLGTAYVSQQNPANIARIEIAESIASNAVTASEYSLTMATEVWTLANQRLSELQIQQPHMRIIGWFHSHPHMGAFFSGTDRTTQAAFFYHPYSIGWVVDPFATDPEKHQQMYLGRESVACGFDVLTL